MTIDERLEKLTGIVEALAATTAAHDDQIVQLITVAEKHAAQIADTNKQWQAYFNTLPRN